MSLRVLVIVLFLVAVLVGSGGAMVSYVFVEHQLSSAAPVLYASGWEGNLSRLFVFQSVIVLAISLAAFLTSLLVLMAFIIRPLNRVAAAIQAFAEQGVRMNVAEFGGAPAEVKKLATAFDEFTVQVEESHARDLEISRIKSDFISTAAHQFRTPLTGIKWALEALEKEPLTDIQKQLVGSAVEKSKHLVTIVGTLLDISAIESGKKKYTFTRVDLAEVAQKVVADFTEHATRGQVSLYFTPPEDPLPPVKADGERIKWVLDNIVENAVRYTPAGGSVRIRLEAGPGRVFMHVRDTGIGINPQDRGNIFERFYRAENAIAKENAGNGLGLYIARTIANDHGGDLNFKSNEDGPGTTFTLSLPVAA